MYNQFNYQNERYSEDEDSDDEIIGDFAAIYPKAEKTDLLVNGKKYAKDKQGQDYVILKTSKQYQDILRIIEQNHVLGMDKVIMAKVIRQVVSTRKKIKSYYEIETIE